MRGWTKRGKGGGGEDWLRMFRRFPWWIDYQHDENRRRRFPQREMTLSLNGIVMRWDWDEWIKKDHTCSESDTSIHDRDTSITARTDSETSCKESGENSEKEKNESWCMPTWEGLYIIRCTNSRFPFLLQSNHFDLSFYLPFSISFNLFHFSSPFRLNTMNLQGRFPLFIYHRESNTSIHSSRIEDM